jgi:hypothetical protein
MIFHGVASTTFNIYQCQWLCFRKESSDEFFHHQEWLWFSILICFQDFAYWFWVRNNALKQCDAIDAIVLVIVNAPFQSMFRTALMCFMHSRIHSFIHSMILCNSAPFCRQRRSFQFLSFSVLKMIASLLTAQWRKNWGWFGWFKWKVTTIVTIALLHLPPAHHHHLR